MLRVMFRCSFLGMGPGMLRQYRTLDKRDVAGVSIGACIEVRIKVCIAVYIGGVTHAPFHEFLTPNYWKNPYGDCTGILPGISGDDMGTITLGVMDCCYTSWIL